MALILWWLLRGFTLSANAAFLGGNYSPNQNPKVWQLDSQSNFSMFSKFQNLFTKFACFLPRAFFHQYI